MSTRESVRSIVDSLEEVLSGDIPRHHQAAAIGRQLHELMGERGADERDRVRALVDRFLNSLPTWGFADLLERRIEYAIRLAAAEGTLIYEEMHKLLSLCEEIQALESLGLSCSSALKVRYQAAVIKRLREESTKVKLVAEDRAQFAAADSWWLKAIRD